MRPDDKRLQLKFSKPQLIKLLLAWVAKNNRLPTQDLINADEEMPHFQTFGVYFGSWKQALIEANLIFPNTIKTCKTHGCLTREECYAYRCSRIVDGVTKFYTGYRCAFCYDEQRKKWAKENPGKVKASVAANYKKNKKRKNAYTLKWQKDNPEKVIEIRRRHAQKNPKWQTIASQKYRALYPDKYRAHQKVFNALKNGTLIKQDCMLCGNTKSHAHHEDYSKPLEVIWLCAKCHIDRHLDIRRHHDAPTPH